MERRGELEKIIIKLNEQDCAEKRSVFAVFKSITEMERALA